MSLQVPFPSLLPSPKRNRFVSRSCLMQYFCMCDRVCVTFLVTTIDDIPLQSLNPYIFIPTRNLSCSSFVQYLTILRPLFVTYQVCMFVLTAANGFIELLRIYVKKKTTITGHPVINETFYYKKFYCEYLRVVREKRLLCTSTSICGL